MRQKYSCVLLIVQYILNYITLLHTLIACNKYFVLVGVFFTCIPNNFDKFFIDFHPPPKTKTIPQSPLVFGRAAKTPACDFSQEKTGEYWINDAQFILQKHLLRRQNTKTAKNIILFLGDGMSVPTLAAARTYKGQLNSLRGEEQELSFEKFPYVGLSKV